MFAVSTKFSIDVSGVFEQVDGHDLRQATHDEAVEVIRHAKNPVRFVVKSTETDMTSFMTESPSIDKLSNLQEVGN